MIKFLLVGESRKSWLGESRKSWLSVLNDAIKPLGELDVCREAEAMAQVEKHSYSVVVIDAGEVDHAEDLILRLRARKPSLRVIVVTAAPTWQLVRRVLLSGATDCINKYTDKKKLSAFLSDTLDRTGSLGT